MARLRKPGAPETTIFIPPSTTKATRTSPRKAPRESQSTRELRYTSSQDAEDSFLVPKAPVADTPSRKQRVLRPVASNSRLLRKLSDESLASPQKKERREKRETGSNSNNSYLYSKTLAKSVARKQAKGRNTETVVQSEPGTTVDGIDEDVDDVEKSVLCENEEENISGKEKQVVQNEEDEDEKDEELVRPINRNLPQRRNRIIESDTEDEDADEHTSERSVPESKSLSRQALDFQKAASRAALEMPPPLQSARPPHRKGDSAISNWAQDVIDLTSSPAPPASLVLPPPDKARSSSFAASSRPTSSTSNDVGAILQFSPTPAKQRSPRKAPPVSRPSTPPFPPSSPSKLVSPSKKRHQIPQAPDLRPSLDAFWAPEVVNDWNEKHSPKKELISPRKQKWRQDLEAQINAITISDGESDAAFPSPTVSPRKKKASSPSKKVASSSASPTVAQIRAQRKGFASRRHALADSFVAELDTTIAHGRISTLSESTGGIKLIWSKTLKTTAGRANWRREQIRLRTGPSPADIRTEIRHHCSIELAEKVIDDEERLYNVLAHEYCHLTTFMISEIRNNPHGAEFKTWGRKVTSAFKHKGVEVTTKHSYKIDYKYVWECIACGYEFKRHSKSVDPVRHSCGRCKGRLVQTKPTPRQGGVGGAVGKDGKREKSEYQVYVKANFSRVKKELESKGLDTQMGKVMEAVARQYRETKESKSKVEVKEMELALEGLNLD